MIPRVLLPLGHRKHSVRGHLLAKQHLTEDSLSEVEIESCAREKSPGSCFCYFFAFQPRC